jgi:DNA-binding response OmpR family regulator
MPESTTALKVLVAEDEPAMLSLVARHIRSLGFSVVEASEGDVAWELAQKHRPDLVILDVMMPGMSGWEICRRLKGSSSDGAFAKTAVIMLTGIGENLNDMTSALFAADAWLNKPFNFNDLDAKIRETLGRYAKQAPVGHGAEGMDDLDDGEGAQASPRPDAKQPAPKKATGKKAAAKRPAPKKAAAKQPAPKKAVAKRPAPKKAAAKQPAPKKAVAKQPAPKKAVAKRPAPKKAAAKQPAPKKAAAKQPAPKKAVAKKPAPKKAAAKGR